MKIFHINTHTKTRILAFLREICLTLTKSSLSLEEISDMLLQKIENYREFLYEYHKERGIPVGLPEKKYFVSKYIELAEQMELIVKERDRYKLTKFGEILVLIGNEVRTPNPMQLNHLEIAFFLRRILQRDSIYILPLLKNLDKCTNSFEVSSSFKNWVLSYLKEEFLFSHDEYFRKRIKAIKEWKNEKKYVESLVPPRIYWLFDLRLIDLKLEKRNLVYTLTPVFKEFKRYIDEITHLNEIKKWLDNCFYYVFYSSFFPLFKFQKRKIFRELVLEQQEKILNPYLEEFLKRKTLTPPTVSFRFFSEIACLRCLNRGIVCEIVDIKKFFSKIREKEKYFIHWDPVIDDGIISKF